LVFLRSIAAEGERRFPGHDLGAQDRADVAQPCRVNSVQDRANEEADNFSSALIYS
jgi:hypothetical protein